MRTCRGIGRAMMGMEAILLRSAVLATALVSLSLPALARGYLNERQKRKELLPEAAKMLQVKFADLLDVGLRERNDSRVGRYPTMLAYLLEQRRQALIGPTDVELVGIPDLLRHEAKRRPARFLG